jgi:hypothetical protein
MTGPPERRPKTVGRPPSSDALLAVVAAVAVVAVVAAVAV